jgi:uncharacterized membrane protein
MADSSTNHQAVPRTARVNAVDLLRGIVMVIMLLDHTREFTHRDFLNFDPSDFSRTNTMLFFTRWVTHFCAPVFVFLAGTGAYLQLLRGKSKAELSRFLITRGLWLIVLELTIIRVIVWFNLDFHFAFMLQVIWVIGVAMILLAVLLYLPLRAVAIASLAVIALHNLLDGIRVQGFSAPGQPLWGAGRTVWLLLHQQGMVFLTPDVYGLVLYPLIPWVAVLTAGYCFGVVYEWDAARRQRFLWRLGCGLLAIFVVLRAVNVYGDPSRWSGQKNAWFTALSFLNVSKYPPSLLFLLLTLGAAMLALPWFERMREGWFASVMMTFGRVPLFYYLGQWLVVHGLALLLARLAGQPTGWLFVAPLEQPRPNPGNLGFSLWVAYACWLAGLALLYPLCRWFAELKRRRRDWWLSYL